MIVQQREHYGQGAFYIEENGNSLAEMTYCASGDDTITIDHTEVDESLRGKDVGKQLVECAVEYARAKNLKIVAVCPFVKKTFEKSEQYKDVWKQ